MLLFVGLRVELRCAVCCCVRVRCVGLEGESVAYIEFIMVVRVINAIKVINVIKDIRAIRANNGYQVFL